MDCVVVFFLTRLATVAFNSTDARKEYINKNSDGTLFCAENIYSFIGRMYLY
jgi:hypothetical protein